MYKNIKGYHSDIINYSPVYEENLNYVPSKSLGGMCLVPKVFIITSKFISHSLKQRNMKYKQAWKLVMLQRST